MKSMTLLLTLIAGLSVGGCMTANPQQRTPSSESVDGATSPESNEASTSGDEEEGELSPDQLAQSMNISPDATGEDLLQQQNAARIQMCEQDPTSCIEKASNGVKIHAELVKQKGSYVLVVSKNGKVAYSCKASPGKPGKESQLTPIMKNQQPWGMEKDHVVSKKKSYAGHHMRNVVWIRGGVAIHDGVVTGQRASHGCIRVTCGGRFYNDVKASGLANTRVTVSAN